MNIWQANSQVVFGYKQTVTQQVSVLKNDIEMALPVLTIYRMEATNAHCK
jgi:hypothetical protein